MKPFLLHNLRLSELVTTLKSTYPKQYEEREDAEHKSGVYNLPLPPTPPKVLDGFNAISDAFGDGGGIIMQMPMGQFVMIPMLPSPGNQYSCLIVRWKEAG